MVSGPNEMDIMQGDTVEITCSFTGLPTPSATWMFAEKTITPNEKYSVELAYDTITLTIRDVQTIDAAVYTLVVENIVGKATHQVSVLVSGK